MKYILGGTVKQFPAAHEGDLSRQRADLVNGKTLTLIGTAFHLSDHIIVGRSEAKTGGKTRPSIIADTVEAIIAAIYLDSDFSTCQKTVLTWYADRLSNIGVIAETKDAKSALQEHCQKQKLPLPTYTIIDVIGPAHEQRYFVTCQIDGLPTTTKGHGTGRRDAEQAAAKFYIETLE